jgi:uncharacterized protein DUF6869
MTWCDERLGFVQAADGSIDWPDAAVIDARLASLNLDDLMRGWREQATNSLREETPGSRAFHVYFDRLAYHDPERAVSFIEAMLVQEQDDALVALIAEGKLLGQLLHFQGPRVAQALQELAVRCIFGAVVWSIGRGMVEDEDAKGRLLAITDTKGYESWKARHRAGRVPPDFAALTPAELAPLWVEIMEASVLDREKDENWSVLFDFQCELACEDPLKALELVKAILAIEDSPNLLGLLAAGLLEDLLPSEDGPIVDAIVAEAESDPRFRHLLGGVWFSGLGEDMTPRLEKARGGESW